MLTVPIHSSIEHHKAPSADIIAQAYLQKFSDNHTSVEHTQAWKSWEYRCSGTNYEIIVLPYKKRTIGGRGQPKSSGMPTTLKEAGKLLREISDTDPAWKSAELQAARNMIAADFLRNKLGIKP
jgi:hypothetical protein